MKRPTEPNQEDCCNSGCNPCIFEVYEHQLKLYKTSQQVGETSSTTDNAISQLEYTTFYVTNNIDLMNEHKLILFQLTTGHKNRVLWTPGNHFLFKYLSKEINCTRAFTPLFLKKIEEKYDFAILVKRYVNGLVSNHLYNLNKGDITLWRGSYGHYKHVPNKFSKIYMIAQGTGIAPLYSIIDQIINNEEDMTNIYLYYCCKNMNTILLRDELYYCSSYWNFNYEVFLSDGIAQSIKYKEPILSHRFNLSHLQKLDALSNSEQFLVCGSNKFSEQYKKSLVELGIKDESVVTF